MIINLILKNLKIIFRSPFTTFLLILSPILLMLIVGFTYSGTSFTHTTIGSIQSESDLFDVFGEGIDFVNFNEDSFESSRSKCINSLKNSDIEMCINFKEQYDSDGNLISAQINYFIDNTRLQLSEIIIRNFNNLIDAKTKEISIKTIEDIFDEVKKTVEFMNQSNELIGKLEDDLAIAKIGIINAKELLKNSEEKFDSTYLEIKKTQSLFNSYINENEAMLNGLEKDLSDLENIIDDSSNSISSTISDIEDIESDIEDYALVDADIYNYVNINQIKSVINDLEDIADGLDNSKSGISNLRTQIIDVKILDEMKDMIDEMVDSLENSKEQLSFALVQTNNILNNVEDREKELNDVRLEISEKLNYFNELSKKDASTITQPILKKTSNLFKDFKRVHQLSPIVVILVLLFIGLLLSNVIVSLEVNSKAYFRNLISPVKQSKFVLALFFTSLFIILIQVFFLFLILNFLFGIAIFSNFISLLLIIIHLLVVFILIGMLLSFMFELIQVSILATTFVMLFMFLLSDIIIPIEIMPSFVYSILQYSPVVVGENLIRQIFFFNNFILSVNDLIVFYPYIIILIILVLIASNRRKKKLF